HPDTLRTLGNLGVNYRDAGRVDDGFRCLEEALALARKRPGPMRADLAGLFGELADSYDRADRLDKAESLYRELLEQASQQYGRNDPRAATLMAKLGTNLIRQQKYAEAQRILAACLAIRNKIAPDDWTTFNTRSVLGGALLGQRKFSEAEPLLMQGYEGMKAREAKIPAASRVRLIQALERLMQLYEAWEKKPQAAQWRKVLEEAKANHKK